MWAEMRVAKQQLIIWLGPAQILQRAYEFFTNNPDENDYRGFFTYAVNWFFCLVRRTDEAEHFYITDLLVFDLTSYDGVRTISLPFSLYWCYCNAYIDDPSQY